MNLFDRLPNGLFGPLTGRYNRRAWELLVRLSERFFGADCVPPYAEGYLHEQVTKEIERFLLDEQWEEESADAAATPINVGYGSLSACARWWPDFSMLWSSSRSTALNWSAAAFR